MISWFTGIPQNEDCEMRNRTRLLGLGLLTLLCLLAFAPNQGSAALVWSEYFDELDADIWTYQSCQIIDG